MKAARREQKPDKLADFFAWATDKESTKRKLAVIKRDEPGTPWGFQFVVMKRTDAAHLRRSRQAARHTERRPRRHARRGRPS